MERVPVANQHLALAKLLPQCRRHDIKVLVVVIVAGRDEHLQAPLDRETGRHDEDVLGEAGVLRVGDLVQDLPGDHHRHDDGLAGAGRHLGAQPLKRSAVAGDVDAHPLRWRRFGQPDQRLDGFELAEEKPVIALLGVVPVLKQPLGDPGHAGVARFAPRLDPRPDLVDGVYGDEQAGVVERTRAVRGDHVAGRPAARLPARTSASHGRTASAAPAPDTAS